MIKFTRQILQKFSSSNQHTVCIVAGGPHQDLIGSKLIKTIKKHNKNFNFMGMGGKLMETEGLDRLYGDINKFCNKDILNAEPSAFITLGNDFFMSQFYFEINSIYESYDKVKPPCFFYDRTHCNQRHEFLEYMDYCFSVIPRQPVNYQNFNFPSQIVGHDGIGRAWQYLYQKSEHFKQLQTDQNIYLSPEFQKHIVEKLVKEERNRFRTTHQLTDQQTVFFFAPGNTATEIEFSIPKFEKGMKEFFSRDLVKHLPKDHFAVVVSIPEDSSKEVIEKKLSTANFGCRTILVREKYSAMAGSDGGIVHNGEMVSECAAMQLPVAIVDSLPFLQAYHTQLYNDWNNDLNIATTGETQQELLSNSCTPWRIAEELIKFHSDPQLKFYLMDRFEKLLYQMVPLAHDVKGTEVTKDNVTLVKHTYSIEAMAQKIINASYQYEKSDKNVASYKIRPYREEFMKKLTVAI